MIRPELNVRLANSPGALAAVCRALADARVNIVAMSLEATGHLRLVVDNHVSAEAVLRDRHQQVVVRDVLLVSVPHAIGALAGALDLVATAGVNVDYAMLHKIFSGGGDGRYSPAECIGTKKVIVTGNPDDKVWVLDCEDASYRVHLMPDMAARVERLP